MSKIVETPESADHPVVFQEKAISSARHHEKWWFSIVDVYSVLTDSFDAGTYWRKLKQRPGEKDSEVVTFCHRSKLEPLDGKA